MERVGAEVPPPLSSPPPPDWELEDYDEEDGYSGIAVSVDLTLATDSQVEAVSDKLMSS